MLNFRQIEEFDKNTAHIFRMSANITEYEVQPNGVAFHPSAHNLSAAENPPL